jgi:peptide deformylase
MRIVTYPAPVLRRRAADVDEINPPLRDTVGRMADTMYDHHGVGLAAPQVGLARRVIVVNPTGEPDGLRVLVNPVIVERRGAMEGEEGCLSFPQIYGVVQRSSYIKVRAYDLEGNDVEITATDFFARVLQHEIDHVDGMLFIDRMLPESRVRAREALKALEETHEAEAGEGGGGS